MPEVPGLLLVRGALVPAEAAEAGGELAPSSARLFD